MTRLFALIAVLTLAIAPAAVAAPHLERVVLVMRHGVRPPTQTNEVLAPVAAQPWPTWPVAPGELTPHGAATVKLMAQSVARAYRRAGLLPAKVCDAVSVWSDSSTRRTVQSGQILTDALAPGCGLITGAAPETPRDPLFSGSDNGDCKVDPDKARAAMTALAPGPDEAQQLIEATARLQAVFAPNACSGGPGTCFATHPTTGSLSGSSLAEDLLLEYAEGMPMESVGWGRASEADIASIMQLHERAFRLLRDTAYSADRRGAPMARVILATLSGAPVGGGPVVTSTTRVLALSGHDSNIIWTAGVFGLAWTFPDEPEMTAPATTLAFELWSDHGQRYVRPVIYYETLDQLRTLAPSEAHAMPLQFKDCATGPMGSCPLKRLETQVEAVLPADCTDL